MTALLVLAALGSCNGEPPCSEGENSSLFGRYVEPLIGGGQPSSCNQCHLSGVDLSLFVREDPCRSMACLVEQELVDLAAPESSTVLEWILRAEPSSSLITAEVIEREYDGMLAWIEYSGRCGSEACGEIADPCSGSAQAGQPPPGAPTPLGSCSEDDLSGLFYERVFHWRDRCGPACHGEPHWEEEFAAAPLFIDLDFGNDEPSRRAAALRTMYNLAGLQAFDTDNPVASRLLTKGLAEAAGGLSHGGGDKFDDTGDPAYLDFLHFAQEYAICFNGSTP